ncbi:MAG: hypothetical protein GX556_08535 [Fibrobacter sp.]|nr:hypothetical protein [Fibrobacter sp.]
MSVKKIVYAGLDVDNAAFHGTGLVLETEECFEFRCKPDHGVLRKKLNELFKVYNPTMLRSVLHRLFVVPVLAKTRNTL